jgi:hypothetical protein
MIYYYSRPYVEYSNGTKLGYRLISELNSLGYKAYNVCHSGIGDNTPSYYKPNIIDLHTTAINPSSEDIVIYPEEISGNPLHAMNCVRYLLCSPMSITGKPIDYGPSDYILSYSRIINDTLPQLYILEDERPLYEELRKTQKEDAMVFYFGKTEMKNLSSQVSSVLTDSSSFPQKKSIITRLNPESHAQTMEMLAKAQFLISFDGLTNLNYEATLLGTPVILASDPYTIDREHFNIPLYGFFHSFNEYAHSNTREPLDLAYTTYCKHIEGQRQSIAKAFTLITAHFQRIQEDADYAAEIAKRNQEQKEVDKKKEEGLQNIQLESIFFLQQVPHKIKKLCGQSTPLDFLYPKHVKSILKKMGLFDISKKMYLKLKK